MAESARNRARADPARTRAQVEPAPLRKTMTPQQVLGEFRAAGALLDGHFILSSGLHSRQYLQCARVMMDARRGARLCRALAAQVQARMTRAIDLVVSPAMGGVIVGHEMGRQLKVPAMFLEREGGVFTLRRGFVMPPGARCLMVEDIVTTGRSSREAMAAIRRLGGRVAGAACLVDRSGGRVRLGVRFTALAVLEAATWSGGDLPDDLKALPPCKPGSRHLA